MYAQAHIIAHRHLTRSYSQFSVVGIVVVVDLVVDIVVVVVGNLVVVVGIVVVDPVVSIPFVVVVVLACTRDQLEPVHRVI